MDIEVMRRDSSFWASHGYASKYHVPRVNEAGIYGHKVALCSKRIQLLKETTDNMNNVGILMCKRCSAMLAAIDTNHQN